MTYFMADNRLKGKFDLKVIVYFLSFAEQALAYYLGFCLVRVNPGTVYTCCSVLTNSRIFETLSKQNKTLRLIIWSVILLFNEDSFEFYNFFCQWWMSCWDCRSLKLLMQDLRRYKQLVVEMEICKSARKSWS